MSDLGPVPNRPTDADVRSVLPIIDNFDFITNYLDGSAWIDSSKLEDDGVTSAKVSSADVLIPGGFNESGVVRRGKSIIATEEATVNGVTSFASLPTPDRVQNLVLPTDGLIAIAYQAMWKEQVDGQGRAAIFIGANQLKTAEAGTAAPIAQEAACTMAADTYGPLVTFGGGLAGGGAGSLATAYTGHVTTGQLVGLQNGSDVRYGFCYVFAAAGTYTVSVQFRVAASGWITAKNRKLWAMAIGF